LLLRQIMTLIYQRVDKQGCEKNIYPPRTIFAEGISSKIGYAT